MTDELHWVGKTGANNGAALAAALVSAQLELRNPENDRFNAHFKNKYASLQALTAFARPILAKHGLTVVQQVCSISPETIIIRTTLLHKSGDSMWGDVVCRVGGNIQQTGAVITYMRRYQFSAILGIAGDDDDDAESVVAETREQPKPKKAPKEAPAAPGTAKFRWYTVLAVDVKQGKSKQYWVAQLHDIDMGNDLQATTFSATLGERLRASIGSRAQIEISEKSKDGRTWVNVEDVI